VRQALALAPKRAAALFVDLQEEHRRDPRYLVAGFDAILAHVRELQAAARQAGISIFHAGYIVDPVRRRPFHPMCLDGTSAFSDKDSPLTAFCPEVGPLADEDVIIKSDASAFSEGSLAQRLQSRAIEWLFIAGVWTEACVAATVKDAVDQGFHVILVKDACGSASRAMHETGILNLANRLYGGAVTSTIDACRLMRGESVPTWMVEGSVPLRFTYENAASLYDEL